MTKQRAAEKKRRGGLMALIICIAVVAVLAVAFFAYTSVYYPADPDVREIAAGYGVEITEGEGYITVAPEKEAATTGYIFYPGGKVEAEAYLPYLAGVAEEGYLCVLLEVPFKLAIFDMDAAGKVIPEYPGITHWAVGGHSLGGVAAAGYARSDNSGVDGLVLLAAYPSGDLSQTGLEVLSVTASNDQVLNKDAYEEALPNLPGGTQFALIEGGNHSQFGRYGHQDGDGEATISEDDQRGQTTAATVALLEEIAA